MAEWAHVRSILGPLTAQNTALIWQSPPLCQERVERKALRWENFHLFLNFYPFSILTQWSLTFTWFFSFMLIRWLDGFPSLSCLWAFYLYFLRVVYGHGFYLFFVQTFLLWVLSPYFFSPLYFIEFVVGNFSPFSPLIDVCKSEA